MDNVHRVLFHELGHFVARQLNFLYYSGQEPYEIKVFPSVDHSDDYCGRTEVKRPEGSIQGEPVPTERLPSYLLSCVYGCIFQSYFQESRLNDCFRTYGESDIQNFTGALQKHKIFNREKFDELKLQIFERLVRTRGLEIFRQIAFDNYLQAEDEHNFSVSIDKLKEDIEPYLNQHLPFYKEFEAMYSEAIKVNQ